MATKKLTKQEKLLRLFRFYDIKPSPIPLEGDFPEFLLTPASSDGLLARGKLFSIFKTSHAREAASIYNYLINGPESIDDSDDFFDICEELKQHRNEGLYLYAITVAILHRPDTASLHIPPLWQLNTRAYFKAPNIHYAQFSSKASKKKTVPAHVIQLAQPFTTGNYIDPENKVAWWREDIGLNAHHFHWHQVYPWAGVKDKAGKTRTKDREGELFYYMHEQMLARYDAERIAVGLPRVEPYEDWSSPIQEGYNSHLTDYYGTHQYSPRPANMTLADDYADDTNNPYLVTRQRYYYDRLMDAINTGVFHGPNGKTTPVDIVKLGAAVEASISSPNPKLYGGVSGGIHNMGHELIAIITDPDGRYETANGVMGDTGTAVRDLIFLRWHKFVDSIFVQHKETLEPYKTEELLFDGVLVDDIKIQAGNNNPENTLTTEMKKQEVDISKDMFLFQQGGQNSPPSHTEITVEVERIHHEDFTYSFTVTNKRQKPIDAVFRVFIAPTEDQNGTKIPLADQRRLFIEMDKFVPKEKLKKGKTTIKRSSTESSVIKPPDKCYQEILDSIKKGKGECTTCRDHRYCTCGWPYNMLVPRGTPAGMTFDLFVMLTNWKADRVDTNDLDQGTSYCGVRSTEDKVGEKYPDKRPMGFPFDRVFPTKADDGNPLKYAEDLADAFDNIKTTQITITFNDVISKQTGKGSKKLGKKKGEEEEKKRAKGTKRKGKEEEEGGRKKGTKRR